MSAADIKEVIVLGASGGFGTLFSQVCMHPIVAKLRMGCAAYAMLEAS